MVAPAPARTRSRRTVVLVATCLLAGACGGGGGGEAGSAGSGAQAVDTAPGGAGEGLGGAAVGGDERTTVAARLAACGAGEDVVEDPPASQDVTTAVGVDDPSVTGAGDDVVPDLGDPALDVRTYDLALSVDGGTIAAEATLEVAVLEQVRELRLDLVGLDVTSVTVDGAPVDARREGAKLVVPADAIVPGEPATIAVCYGGEPRGVASPAIGEAEVGWATAADGIFVLAEPEGARTWFPANDVPTDKATFAAAFSVPAGVTAVSNGELVAGPVPCTGAVQPEGAATPGDDSAGSGGDGPSGVLVEATDGSCPGSVPAAASEVDGRHEFHWRMDAPMAPYLATLAVGDYERYAYPPAGGVPIEGWVPAGSEGAVADLAFQTEAVTRLTELLGPFPFATYGGVVTPGSPDDEVLAGVALEAQGMSIYATGATLDWVVVHETAHQWVGDSVTVTSWRDDLWWVEGFATYAQFLFAEVLAGPAAYDAEIGSAVRTIEGSRGAIGEPADDELFDALRYQGGALVFHALRREIGDDAFFEFLRSFVERYRYDNASTAELIAVAEDVSGEDLDGFFAAWLDTPERPPVPE